MDYYRTPNEYPSSETIKQIDPSRIEYPIAHAQYDDNYLYIPTFIGKGIAYLKVDKHCIMDAIEHWKSLEEGDNNG